MDVLRLRCSDTQTERHHRNAQTYCGKRFIGKYGYPYVGKNWIPHITIGSLEIPSKKIFEYLEGLFNFSREITINKLGLFKINGDSHELLKKIEF